MKKNLNNFLLLIMVFLLQSACAKKFDPKLHGPYNAEPPLQSDKNVKAPKSLIKKIESQFLKHYRLVKPDDEISDAKLLVSIPRKYLGFNVFLRPKTNKLALEQATEITFPRGGGFIDLANIIKGEVGSFYMNMQFDWPEIGLDESDVKNLKVYFLSNSKSRQIDGEQWGAGCRKYFDITSFYKSVILKKGLLLNATDQRYLSTLAGTFYFILTKNGELHLATASFVDNRYTNLMCRS